MLRPKIDEAFCKLQKSNKEMNNQDSQINSLFRLPKIGNLKSIEQTLNEKLI
jgi:hypothetical protein